MKLVLRNGYPFPYPSNLTEEQQAEISYKADDTQLILEGVAHFEWLHTVTVEFSSNDAFLAGEKLTGWKRWEGDYTLEAGSSGKDGYDHPAIVVKDKAYCGFILMED